MENLNIHKLKVVFFGLAKDCEKSLPETCDWLYSVSKLFEICDIYVLTNDNTDNTINILKRYEKKFKLNIIRLDGIDLSFPNRNDKICQLRNIGLALIRSSKIKYHFFINLDMDGVIKFINLDIFKKNIRELYFSKYSAFFAFSKPIYYDLYPFRKKKVLNHNVMFVYKILRLLTIKMIPKRFIKILSFSRYNKKISNINYDFEVISAFCGLGIYKMKDIENLWYGSRNKLGIEKCEHLIFNELITNPKMVKVKLNTVSPQEHIDHFKR